MPTPRLNRRNLMALAAASAPAVAISSAIAAPADDQHWKISSGKINQSVVAWCFKPMTTEQLATHAAAL
jgi:hydroxypyruvate isomerase